MESQVDSQCGLHVTLMHLVRPSCHSELRAVAVSGTVRLSPPLELNKHPAILLFA